jgi:hypothetical protein
VNSYNGFSPQQRERAAAWLREQWRSDARPRPSRCCACGQDRGIFDAHAEDYSEPFGDQTDAYPLCYACHMMVHCRFRNHDAWEAYKEKVRAGGRIAPFLTREWYRFKDQCLEHWLDLDWVFGTPPVRDVLGEIG